MAIIKVIRSDEEHAVAMERIDQLWGASDGTPEREELNALFDLVETYEAVNYPIDPPSPINFIEFQMDQLDLTKEDLIPIFGSRAMVSDVLTGDYKLTMPMARALHERLGVPMDILLKITDTKHSEETSNGTEPARTKRETATT